MKKELSDVAKNWLMEYRKKNPLNQDKMDKSNKFYLKLKQEKIKNYLKSKT